MTNGHNGTGWKVAIVVLAVLFGIGTTIAAWTADMAQSNRERIIKLETEVEHLKQRGLS